MVYLAEKTEELSPEGSLSDRSEQLLQRHGRGGRTWRSFCNKKQVVGTLKDFC